MEQNEEGQTPLEMLHTEQKTKTNKEEIKQKGEPHVGIQYLIRELIQQQYGSNTATTSSSNYHENNKDNSQLLKPDLPVAKQWLEQSASLNSSTMSLKIRHMNNETKSCQYRVHEMMVSSRR